jgi:hypothetical protein
MYLQDSTEKGDVANTEQGWVVPFDEAYMAR